MRGGVGGDGRGAEGTRGGGGGKKERTSRERRRGEEEGGGEWRGGEGMGETIFQILQL